MDLFQREDSSPPPKYVKHLITCAIGKYKIAATKLANKKVALANVHNKPPRSINFNPTINLASSIANLPQAVSIQQQFNQQVIDVKLQLTQSIKQAIQLEIDSLKQEVDCIPTQAREQVVQFYFQVHNSINADTIEEQQFSHLVQQALNHQQVQSKPVMDCIKAISFLDSKISQITYDIHVQQVSKQLEQAAIQAKKQAAQDCQMDTSNSVLVTTLVNQSIRKQVGPLKKEINQLRHQLNCSASQQVVPTGTRHTPKNRKSNQNGKGKAEEKEQGSSTRSKTSNGNQSKKSQSQSRRNQNKTRSTRTTRSL